MFYETIQAGQSPTGRTTEYMVFEGVAEAAAEARKACENPARITGGWEMEFPGNVQFIGRKFDSWSEVEQAALGVWRDGLKIIDGMLKELASETLPQPVSRRRRRFWSEDDGDELSLDRLERGQPYWEGRKRQAKIAPAVITLVTDMSTNCGIESKSILWRGAATLVLSKLLEEAGYSVDLWCAKRCAETYLNGSDWFAGVHIKRPGDPLEIGNLVSAVSGWFYRTVLFGVSRVAVNWAPKYSLGAPECIRKFVPMLTGNDSSYVFEGIWSRPEAVDAVRDALRTLNIQSETALVV